jgi:hypothetical protein
MYHRDLVYELNGEKKQIDATMDSWSDDQIYTSAKLAGCLFCNCYLKILNKEVLLMVCKFQLLKRFVTYTKRWKITEVNFKEVPYLGYNPLNIKL